MPDKTMTQKLAIKAGNQIFIVNAPRGYKANLAELPKGARIVTQPKEMVDVIQVFVANRGELEMQLAALKALLAPNGSLWVTYYKGTSKHKTDINRDSIHAYAKRLGLLGVALIAIDDDWAAMRLKHV